MKQNIIIVTVAIGLCLIMTDAKACDDFGRRWGANSQILNLPLYFKDANHYKLNDVQMRRQPRKELKERVTIKEKKELIKAETPVEPINRSRTRFSQNSLQSQAAVNENAQKMYQLQNDLEREKLELERELLELEKQQAKLNPSKG